MPKVVVAGCGFTGLAVARLLHGRGWDVLGLNRSGQLAGEGFAVAACDISNRESVASLGARADVVVHCASSSRGGADAYRAVYLEGARHLFDVLGPGRFIFASSTSVYAQTDGSVVTEESPCEPERETGRLLREAEELVLLRGGIVARLAGIYGPGRSVLLRKFFSGEAVIEGDGGRFINQVHRDDIATALALLCERGAGIYNVCDDLPVMQRELYARLAERFGLPLPPSGPIDPNRKRGVTSKRVSNARFRALGWAPRHATFFDALDAESELVALAR